jgi:protein tyrosine phosphatase (PTP) superfamily phosphohydrolase (DUF442 family)
MNPTAIESIPYFVRLTETIGTAGQPNVDRIETIREAGYEAVINLRPESDTPPEERALVEREGMEYVQLPVVWDAPTVENVEQFFAEMRSREGKRVFVHCAMNMRVSVFMYLYRVVVQNVSPAEAADDMHRIWTPNETWQRLIDQVLERR